MAKKTKIAILGGGLAGISTALFLSDPKKNPNAENHDITVYQMGWRLGGKCASGRNMDRNLGGRIEEHGLHVMLGFYENLFRMVRATMAEWKMPPGHPWHTPNAADRWSMAFTPASFAPLVEPRKDGSWTIWPLHFPPLPGEPGDEEPPKDDVMDFLLTLDAWLDTLLGMSKHPAPDESLKQCLKTSHKDQAVQKRVSKCRHQRRLINPLNWFTLIFDLVRLLLFGIKRQAVRRFRTPLKTKQAAVVNKAEMLYTFVDLGSALFCGLLYNAPRIYAGTLDVLDNQELRAFLRKYGADDSSLESPIVDSLYDAAFASRRGTGRRRDEKLAAGVAIRSMIGILLSYKGAPWWKMNAGMGDTIFVPAYQVLKDRGVKFKFFHRVRGISLTRDKKEVQHVDIGRQLHTKDPDSGIKLPNGEYEPLETFDTQGLRVGRGQGPLEVWPSEPIGAAIASQLPSNPAELEDPDAKADDVESVRLVAGTDFDWVVLAIPVGVLKSICPELIAANSKFKDMVEKVKTVRTVAYQIWLSKDLPQLGWTYDAPVLGNFRDPLNTWADMSHLLNMEGPQRGQKPSSISYFCGPMPDDIVPAQALQYAVKQAGDMLNDLAKNFLPKALLPNQPKFDPALVMSDYARPNINSSERYTLSLPGTTKYRLRANESGFSNLVFAGDWTRNNFNVGAAEPTVMSAMQASHAVCGYPKLEDIVRNSGP
jgi:uncharacterized protein with NAD-binding domain and iron-sulfur cluster